MPRVLLLRHGQSEWNASGRWQGQADAPLSDLGRRQAAAAAERLAGFGLVLASDLSRARDTAEIIGRELGLAVQVDARLRERDVGVWTGLTDDQIDTGWPGYRRDRLPPEGFEGNDALLTRVSELFGNLVRSVPTLGDAVAVTHGGVVYTLEEAAGRTWAPLPNLGGVWVTLDESGPVEIGERVDLLAQSDVPSTAPPRL